MRALIIAISLLGVTVAARAEVNVAINIGVNIPAFPHLVAVPGYPVYYAPDADLNYFFYDGQYWLYTDDGWYSSSWYDGPWLTVEPLYVPLFVLRVPVRYYHRPPVYFSGWSRDAPPHWGEHWGRSWEQRRAGWDHWDHKATPKAAPLPTYQRQYSGNRYPRSITQQQSIRTQNYHYQERDSATRKIQQRSQAAAERTPVKNSPAANTPSRAQKPEQLRSESRDQRREQTQPSFNNTPQSQSQRNAAMPQREQRASGDIREPSRDAPQAENRDPGNPRDDNQNHDKNRRKKDKDYKDERN